MYSVWGIGTRLYGDSDYNYDEHTYITTKWITIFFIPILPLKSYKVIRESRIKTKFYAFPPGFSQSTEFILVPEEKLYWRQILKTYALGLLPMIGFAILIILAVVTGSKQ